jgi:hypothetical protein
MEMGAAMGSVVGKTGGVGAGCASGTRHRPAPPSLILTPGSRRWPMADSGPLQHPNHHRHNRLGIRGGSASLTAARWGPNCAHARRHRDPLRAPSPGLAYGRGLREPLRRCRCCRGQGSSPREGLVLLAVDVGHPQSPPLDGPRPGGGRPLRAVALRERSPSQGAR